MQIAKQTTKVWKNETGTEIPVNRITKSEKLRETKAYQLAIEAAKINLRLDAFKDFIREACEDVDNVVRDEHNVKKKDSKGNFTWFNFDRSIKVERSINEKVAFDDSLIALCKEKLDEYMNRALHGSDDAEFMAEIIKDAFSTTNGKLDTKKVMSLLKHEEKSTSSLYKEAMKFLKESIRRPDSKTYYRVWVKNTEGEYESIELNFSNI